MELLFISRSRDLVRDGASYYFFGIILLAKAKLRIQTKNSHVDQSNTKTKFKEIEYLK